MLDLIPQLDPQNATGNFFPVASDNGNDLRPSDHYMSKGLLFTVVAVCRYR